MTKRRRPAKELTEPTFMLSNAIHRLCVDIIKPSVDSGTLTVMEGFKIVLAALTSELIITADRAGLSHAGILEGIDRSLKATAALKAAVVEKVTH